MTNGIVKTGIRSPRLWFRLYLFNTIWVPDTTIIFTVKKKVFFPNPKSQSPRLGLGPLNFTYKNPSRRTSIEGLSIYINTYVYNIYIL